MSVVEREGCGLHYDVAGPANAPAVLLVQGVGVHGDGWRPQVAALSRDYHCIMFDNRGMARSQPVGVGPLTVEQMADDADAVLRAAGSCDAHVVGHSLGGLIALQLALAHRVHVRSLSLLCTFADGGVPNRLTPRMIWAGLRTRLGTRRMRRRAFLRFVMPPDALRRAEDLDLVAADLAPLFGHDLADHPPIVMPQLRAMKRFGDGTARLHELRGLPALVISAADDPIAPPCAGRAIAAALPGARYVEIPNASHGVPIHQADRVNALLLEHLSAAQSRSHPGATSP
jgi:pimeloyl-ACP methyl ester carboxylesterase